jgi:hypothetical protein
MSVHSVAVTTTVGQAATWIRSQPNSNINR